jgi:hypothetical protein
MRSHCRRPIVVAVKFKLTEASVMTVLIRPKAAQKRVQLCAEESVADELALVQLGEAA